MGESERFQEYRHIGPKRKFPYFRDGNAVMALFTINVIFYLLLFFIKVGFSYTGAGEDLFNRDVMQWFSLPSSLTSLSERPWSLLTYMFSDYSHQVLRVLSNMLWLWAFGSVMQQLSGNDKVIPVYIYGGLSGAFFFILSSYLLPASYIMQADMTLLGANASVLGVGMAVTTLSPGYRVLRHLRNGIPMWVGMMIYLFIDLIGMSVMPAPFIMAHLGGAFGGFLFVILLRRGWDGSRWMNSVYQKANNLFKPGKGKGKAGMKETLFFETKGRQPFSKTANITQQRVDEILDKINQKGYHFLTDEEKDILKRAADERL